MTQADDEAYNINNNVSTHLNKKLIIRASYMRPKQKPQKLPTTDTPNNSKYNYELL